MTAHIGKLAASHALRDNRLVAMCQQQCLQLPVIERHYMTEAHAKIDQALDQLEPPCLLCCIDSVTACNGRAKGERSMGHYEGIKELSRQRWRQPGGAEESMVKAKRPVISIKAA